MVNEFIYNKEADTHTCAHSERNATPPQALGGIKNQIAR